MMNDRIKNLTITALMAAMLCISGPLTIPIGIVPVTLINLAIFIVIYIVGMKRATICYLIYLLIGLIGIPVFSGFTGGAQKIMGPTGGFLIGFILMIVIAGLVIDRFGSNKIVCMIGMIAATWALYLCGVLWLSYSANLPLPAAFAKGVLPFIFEVMVKMIIAAVAGPILKSRLSKAGVVFDNAG